MLDAEATTDRLTAAVAAEAWSRDIAAAVRDGVADAEWTSRARPLSLNLVLRTAAPRATPQLVHEVRSLLASYSTSFSLRDRNRVHNIRLAAKAIDGLFLLPGDTFSYNTTVGPRRRSRGFRTAPEIVRGELVPGVGGGICQVSTTLYNVALLADLEVTRRHHHRFPVSYVVAGRDATVSDGGLDLRLRNPHDAPIVLFVSAEGNRVRARVFGAERCKRAVRLMTTRLRPPYTRSGGRRVALVRVVEESGREVRRETISRDSYEPPPTSTRPKPRRKRPPRPRTPPAAPQPEVASPTGQQT
jgi:vancomycin resistance protein YoaR